MGENRRRGGRFSQRRAAALTSPGGAAPLPLGATADRGQLRRAFGRVGHALPAPHPPGGCQAPDARTRLRPRWPGECAFGAPPGGAKCPILSPFVTSRGPFRGQPAELSVAPLAAAVCCQCHNYRQSAAAPVAVLLASGFRPLAPAVQYSTPACAGTPSVKGCLVDRTCVTRSAARTSRGWAFRPVMTRCTCGGFRAISESTPPISTAP